MSLVPSEAVPTRPPSPSIVLLLQLKELHLSLLNQLLLVLHHLSMCIGVLNCHLCTGRAVFVWQTTDLLDEFLAVAVMCRVIAGKMAVFDAALVHMLTPVGEVFVIAHRLLRCGRSPYIDVLLCSSSGVGGEGEGGVGEEGWQAL